MRKKKKKKTIGNLQQRGIELEAAVLEEAELVRRGKGWTCFVTVSFPHSKR